MQIPGKSVVYHVITCHTRVGFPIGTGVIHSTVHFHSGDGFSDQSSLTVDSCAGCHHEPVFWKKKV